MPDTFEEAIAEIKRRVDISDVIGRHVQLKKSGRSMVGLCPFHGEKTPSFYVHPNEGFYKCFGCDAKGDVFTFLEKHTGQSFIDIARSLGAEVSVELPDDGRSPAQRKRLAENKRLTRVLDAAQTYFRQRLRMPEGKPGLHYLHDVRGLSDDEIDQFGIGYGGGSENGLLDVLKEQGFSEQDALTVGLQARSKRGGSYPFYRGRVTFPIRKKNGDLATFGGRALGDRGPKYVNGAQSPLYDKSRDFYGLFEAMPALKRKQSAVLVEGYFDVVALARAGFPTGISPCGTALTPRHVEALGRLTEQVILCLDADVAGQKGMERALLRLLQGGLSVSQVTLLEKDPDTYIQKGETDTLTQLLAGAEDALDLRIQQAVAEASGSVRARLNAIEGILPFLAAPRRDLVREQYIKKAAERLGEERATLEREVQERGQQLITQVLGGRRPQADRQGGRDRAPTRPAPPNDGGGPPGPDDWGGAPPASGGGNNGGRDAKPKKKEWLSKEEWKKRQGDRKGKPKEERPLPLQEGPLEIAPVRRPAPPPEPMAMPRPHRRRARRARPPVDWTDAERGLVRALMCYPRLVPQAAILADLLENHELAVFIRGLDEKYSLFPALGAVDLLKQIPIRGATVPKLFQEVFTFRGTDSGEDFMTEEAAQRWVDDHVLTVDRQSLQDALGEVQRNMVAARERSDDEAWRKLQEQQQKLIDVLARRESAPKALAAPAAAATAALPEPTPEEAPGVVDIGPPAAASAAVDALAPVDPGWTEEFDDDDDAFDF